MSAWVHVAAIARIDYIPVLCKEKELDFDSIFGKELDGYSEEDEWLYAREHENEYLPMGSEGTLQKSVRVSENPHEVARYVVTIFGDLRDVTSGDHIIEWFKQKLRDLCVRQAAITVYEECGCKTKTWSCGLGGDKEG